MCSQGVWSLGSDAPHHASRVQTHNGRRLPDQLVHKVVYTLPSCTGGSVVTGHGCTCGVSPTAGMARKCTTPGRAAQADAAARTCTHPHAHGMPNRGMHIAAARTCGHPLQRCVGRMQPRLAQRVDVSQELAQPVRLAAERDCNVSCDCAVAGRGCTMREVGRSLLWACKHGQQPGPPRSAVPASSFPTAPAGADGRLKALEPLRQVGLAASKRGGQQQPGCVADDFQRLQVQRWRGSCAAGGRAGRRVAAAAGGSCVAARRAAMRRDRQLRGGMQKRRARPRGSWRERASVGRLGAAGGRSDPAKRLCSLLSRLVYAVTLGQEGDCRVQHVGASRLPFCRHF